jgi:hypothetical protein
VRGAFADRYLLAVARGVAVAVLILLAGGAAGCGSSSKHVRTSTAARSPLASLQACFRHHGYAVDVEPRRVRGTAPRDFEFVAVWNLLNPDRIALAVTVSKTPRGATRAAAWTRRTNKRIGKGAVTAPVVQFGRLNVLWTADPDPRDKHDIYGCVRQSL